jgi:hypothetical protein
VRVVHDVDNGAGGSDVLFYTSSDGSSWVKLGNTVTNAGTVTRHDSSALLYLGRTSAGSGDSAGTFYNGIDGTLVANPNFVIHPAMSATVIRDSYGHVWTLAGSAALVGYTKPAAIGLAI